MLPKIEAAVTYLKNGGEKAIITSPRIALRRFSGEVIIAFSPDMITQRRFRQRHCQFNTPMCKLFSSLFKVITFHIYVDAAVLND